MDTTIPISKFAPPLCFGIILLSFSVRTWLAARNIPITNEHKFNIVSFHFTEHPIGLAIFLAAMGGVPFVGGAVMVLEKFAWFNLFPKTFLQMIILLPLFGGIVFYYYLFARR